MIHELFRANEPEIALETASPNGRVVVLQLRDCDGYRLGSLVFSDVQVVCLATQWETFETFASHEKEEVPEDFMWLQSGMKDGYVLFRFLRCESEDDETVLPAIGDRRQAFIVARSVAFRDAEPGR